MPSRSFILVALLVLALGYVGLNLLVKWIYPRQLFPYPESSYESLTGLSFTECSNGNRIAFVYLPIGDPAAPLLFYFHGNGEDIGMNADRFQWFHDQGFSVIALDYPGYGRSTGKPTPESVRQATLATWQYAVEELGAQPETTVLWGRSIGGAPATWLASQNLFGGLILESTFRSVFAVANLPFPLFLEEPFPTESLITQVSAPIVLFHGNQDRIIPVDHSQKLSLAAGENSELILFPEGTHNDLRYVGEEEMADALETLSNRILTRNDGQPQKALPSGNDP